MSLTSPTGSLMNNLMANGNQPEPVAGMGATLLRWTDREAYTVVEVKSPTRIVVQADTATRTDAHGMSEMQAYDYAADPTAPREVFTLRKNGRWVRQGDDSKSGNALALGYRRAYHDYTF